MFASRIIEFGKKFKGRLDDLWLDSALDYVNYNEEMLAFEMLCDYLANYNICLCMEEYLEMIKLAADMEFDLDDASLKYLKYLARRGGRQK